VLKASLKKQALTKVQLNNRVKLLNAAEQTFIQFGFKKTTIEDICQNAGLSKPTFYAQFKNKVDVLSQTLVFVADNLILAKPSRGLLQIFLIQG